MQSSLCQLPPGIELEPITPADQEFLFSVYASTREEELRVVDWPPAEKIAFLHQQYDAQHHHYQTHYAAAQFWIVHVEGTPAGRLYLETREVELRIIDISLLPAYRNLGIGSELLNRILTDAHASGCNVSIHVEMNNPALRLYQRLGFVPLEENGVYLLMEWRPQDTSRTGETR